MKTILSAAIALTERVAPHRREKNFLPARDHEPRPRGVSRCYARSTEARCTVTTRPEARGIEVRSDLQTRVLCK